MYRSYRILSSWIDSSLGFIENGFYFPFPFLHIHSNYLEERVDKVKVVLSKFKKELATIQVTRAENNMIKNSNY